MRSREEILKMIDKVMDKRDQKCADATIQFAILETLLDIRDLLTPSDTRDNKE